MEKTSAQLPEIKLMGIKARTNNASEMDPIKAKIGTTIQKYFHGAMPEKITNRKKPGTTYCVYTEYESDFTGDYTYFVGEEVTSFDNVPEGLSTLTIPAQHYAKFTNESGLMPNVCIDMWQEIWKMEVDQKLGQTQNYIADFEVYDERARDYQNTVLDIYIGIKK